MTGRTHADTARRLEQLWAGDFGNAYTDRNRGTIDRRSFWRALLAAHPITSALEIGCNVGENLLAIAELVGARSVAGVDVNEIALDGARSVLPDADLRVAAAKDLPFADRSFDLVFTAMVLIHQPDDTLPKVMGEVVRCSRRFVLSMEYESRETVDVPYRGQHGALFKRPYGDLYTATFPSLRRVDGGFLGEAEGWDNVTWSLMELAAPTDA